MIIRASDPASSSLTNQTTFTYTPSAVGGSITTNSDKDSFTDGLLTSKVLYDGLGRTTETQQFAPEGVIRSTTSYDALGRTKRVSNPYSSTNEPTYGYIDSSYNGLSRVKTVSTFDGGDAPTGTLTTTYAGNVTTVVDQALKQRRSFTDALGRLTSLDEMFEYPSTAVYATTTYQYDVLDDLTTVTQGSQPQRTFAYDSLKRLTQAFNPESGTINYTYDENGNLKTKIDARSITTTYLCDALNRVSSRAYTNDPQSTPAVTYFYDASGVLYSKGQLTQVTSSVSTYDYLEYDQLGRVKQSKQTTVGGASQGYTFSNYSYNLAGEMTSETYPAGRVVATEYDTAGRVAGVKNQASGLYYAGATASDTTNRIQYAAQGAVSVMKLGNGKWEHTNFNSRLQPLQIGLGTSDTNSSILQLDYGYGATNSNNGNVLTQTITIGATVMTQSYGYDALNRLSSASEGPAWSQSYDCDRYGNRAVRAGSYIPTPALTPQSVNSTDFSAFSSSTNRIIRSGFGYDGAGNLTSDPTTAANAMVYDAENRQISYTKAGVTTTYSYDGDGRRVKKLDSTGTIVFMYNAGGQLIAEYHSDPVPSPAGGGGTSYLTSDHLGSTRVVTKNDGSLKARYDYLPFGEELSAPLGGRTVGMGYGGADSTRQKFTQKERDSESGLDYFGARYYSSAQGRFTSHDPIFVTAKRLIDPQRLNQYAYTRNNPLKFFDPDGMDLALTAKNKDEAEKRFKVFQLGLRKEDRSHVHLVAGNGKNGFARGQFGITADRDYKSDSENFQTVQKLANDHTALGKVSVKAVGDTVTIRLSLSSSLKGPGPLERQSFKIESAEVPFKGYTFFEFRGTHEEGAAGYATGRSSESIINGAQADDAQISATMHHELRHMLLGDFGRSFPRSKHSDSFARGQGEPITEADKQTDRADREAIENAKRP